VIAMSSRSRAVAWLGFGVAVLVLVSPVKLWWARPAMGWITPFLLWIALIVLGAWTGGRRGRDDL
jgi:hypothetical protein